MRVLRSSETGRDKWTSGERRIDDNRRLSIDRMHPILATVEYTGSNQAIWSGAFLRLSNEVRNFDLTGTGH